MRRRWVVLGFIPFILSVGATAAWASQPELSSFFESFVGNWSGTGNIQSAGYAQKGLYGLEFKIAQIGSNSFERASAASLWNGEVQQSLLDFELGESELRLVRPGEAAQDAVILESTPKTLWFATRSAGDGRTYDLVYKLKLSGDTLSGDVEMDYQGDKVSENHFSLTRRAD